jgi:FkbM family methyltransferase
MNPLLACKKSRRNLRESFKTYLMRRYVRSWSDQFEDLILDSYFHRSTGFYIDIGANDPVNISNTYRFYRKGWRGIAVEPNPLLHARALKIRPRDINLNVGIAAEETTLRFYEAKIHQTSSFVEAQVPPEKRARVIDVPCYRLSTLIEKYAPNEQIDFMTVDTEGMDLEVLKTFPWETKRPTIVVVETGPAQKKDIVSAMKYWGYTFYYYSGVNSFFMEKTHFDHLGE